MASSDKYIIGVSDKDTGAEIGTATISASSYKAVIQITAENRYPVIILKSKDTGRPIFRNYIGRVPKSSEVPPQVKTIVIKQVPLDETSTARSLMACEKNVLLPLIVSFSASETPGETVTKEYGEISSTVESPVEEAAGGLANISEMARAVKTVSQIIVSPSITGDVKNVVAPLQSDYSTASSILKIFVSILKKNETQNEVNSSSLPKTIALSGKTIDASTKDEEIAPAVTGIKPLERLLPPVFTPAAGTYDSTVEIVISSNSSGASVFYTDDGSTPGQSSKIFSSKVTAASDITLKAFAAREGAITSEVAVASYKISLAGVTAPPVLSLKPGSYFGTQEVIISCATPGAVAYYTDDGSIPTTKSKLYTGKIILYSSKTIKVITIKSGLLNSSPVTADYSIAGVLARAVFNPAPGTYYETVEVKISSETSGSEIYYTFGTDPVRLAKKYSSPIIIGVPLTINAFAVKSGMGTSEVVTGFYNVKKADPIPPVEGMFFDTNTKTLKWLPVTTNNKKYIYLLKLDGQLVISPAQNTYYDASGLTPGNHILMVSAITESGLASGESGGPYSEPYEFKIPAFVNVPSINNIEYNAAGYLSWEPKIDKLGKAYDYRIMFDNDISNYYVSRMASFGVPDNLEQGAHVARIQAVVLDTSNPFEIKITEEGNWSSNFWFNAASGDKIYKSIAVPSNMIFDKPARVIKWDVSGSTSAFRYDVIATYSSSSSYFFNKSLGFDLSENSVTLAEVNAKLP
ncbi:MAG TPA: chitobiase/beta-hexosaminidase C-terminal domain-containing protein, partial [Candidatus Wallbacteria bacterium]|nr:chitobiase/beta-hexosaminidase C-terminal domain-containing protein [Candidatus Wallbacteria bacterium]